MATNIKITALSDITSANMTFNDLLAVVDMNGTPETKKATVQLAGNLILGGAGGSNFVKAAQATNSETVSNAAQPNITSTGTLTSVTVSGNVDAGNVNGTGGVFTYVSGDGANLTNLPSGSNSAAIANGTSNINIPAVDGNINTSVAGNANILIVTGTGANVTGTFNATGNVVVGNISATNLGNVSPLNLDGNVSNVLRGEGTFAADGVGSYGDSNVVTLLNAFGSNTITTTGVIAGVGSGLSGLVGANVTGEVTFAATANAVAYANVSGTPTLGNISTINIDGAAANVLYGNGVFAAASSPALTGDGYQLANLTGANVTGAIAFATTANAVAYANVSGTPTLGNISTINIDGSASTVLYGNGVFAAAGAGSNSAAIANGTSNINIATADGSATIGIGGVADIVTVSGTAVTVVGGVAATYVSGDGANLAAIAGANVTGAVPFATTANAVAGANVSGEVTFAATANAVAYANVSGTPALGNISTINIDGAAGNVLYGNGAFAPVSSTTAQTVTTAAQPNITSTGTLTSLTVTGALGVTTGLITGDGGGISNIAVGNLVGTINLATFAGTANAVAGANVSGEVTFAATANAVAGANVSGTVPLATTAGTISTNAQPNITSTGTLTSLTVSGNVTGQSYVSAATALQTTPVITSALPAAATAGTGARAMVTDADAGSVFGAALTGAGSLTLPVFSDGTIWRVG